jgi:hypothetical protein
LVVFVSASEKSVAGVELGQNATQTPHVDRVGVFGAEQDFGRSVRSGLNVKVHLVLVVAGRAEIADFYATLALLLQQNVLWLQITVNDLFLL